MNTPVPKTKAEEILDRLVEVNNESDFLNDFQVSRFLKDIDAAMKSGVNIAHLWVCKGLVYSFARQPRNMVSAFLNATRLGANDQVSMFNEGTKYMIYGYNDEAINSFAHVLDKSSHEHLERIAIASFKFDEINNLMIMPEYKLSLNSREKAISAIGLDIGKARQVMTVFFNIIQKHELNVALMRHSVSDGEYQLVFHAFADIEETTQVLREFDSLTAAPDLFEASTKLNVVLQAGEASRGAVA